MGGSVCVLTVVVDVLVAGDHLATVDATFLLQERWLYTTPPSLGHR